MSATASPRVSLSLQIAEMRREIALRESVYPRQVAARKMREAEAKLFMGYAEAILATLTWLQTHEREIKEFLPHAPEIRALLSMAPEDRAAILEHEPAVAKAAREMAVGEQA